MRNHLAVIEWCATSINTCAVEREHRELGTSAGLMLLIFEFVEFVYERFKSNIAGKHQTTHTFAIPHLCSDHTGVDQ